MRTAIKIIGIALGVVVLLIAAAAIVLPLYIDPNDYKDEIAAQVEKRTGRELRIEGDIELSVFPRLALDLGTVALGNAPGFDPDVFARSERMQIRVKLLPLLGGRIETDTVVLSGFELNLARNAQGRTNWADLAQAAEAAPAPEGQAPPAPREGPPVAALAVGGLDIRDATLRWDDAQANQHLTVRDFTLKTGALTQDAPVDVEMGFRFESAQPPLSGRLSGSTRLEADVAAERYRVRDLEIEGEVQGEGVEREAVELRLAADAEADLKADTLSVSGLELGAGGLTTQGNLEVRRLTAKPEFQGAISVAPFNPRELLARLGQTLPQTADRNALTRLELAADLKGTQQRVELDAISLTLDDSTLTGTLSMALGAPTVRFELAADAFDADRYLPPPPKEGQQAAATPGAAAGAAPLPLDTLRALDIDGRARLGRLKVSNLTTRDIQVTVNAKDGLIKVSPIQAALYEGTYAGDIVLDARGDTPRISMDEKLSGVQAEPLLTDLQGKALLSGLAEARARLNARGLGPAQFKRTLNGEIAFSFTDGALKGINVGRILRDVEARIKGQALPAQEGPVETDFTELSGTIQIKDGVATNQDLSAKSPLLRISGRGTADLVDETVDYRLTTTLVATAAGQSGAERSELAGIPVPIRVSGSWRNPSIRPDLEAVAKAKAQEELEKRKGEATEKIEKKLEKELGEGAAKPLKDLLKGLGN